MSEENMEVSTEEVDQKQTRAQNHLLIEREQYLSHGVHIGTKLKTKHTEHWNSVWVSTLLVESSMMIILKLTLS